MSTIFKMQRVYIGGLVEVYQCCMCGDIFIAKKVYQCCMCLQHQNERIRRVGSLYNMQSW